MYTLVCTLVYTIYTIRTMHSMYTITINGPSVGPAMFFREPLFILKFPFLSSQSLKNIPESALRPLPAKL